MVNEARLRGQVRSEVQLRNEGTGADGARAGIGAATDGATVGLEEFR